MKSRYKMITILMAVLIIMVLPISAKGDVMNWYCKRNKEHKQPIIDQNIRFVEKYDGYYLDHKHDDNCNEKVIYLTFDAGYQNGNIAKILDTLKNEEVSGSFFILQNLIQKEPQLVKRMVEDGHLVCNHTAKHKDMSLCESFEEFKEELSALEEIYYDLTGKEMAHYFRPPEGKFCLNTLKYAQELGYKTIFWSFAYADWDNDRQPSQELAKNKILENIHNGEVMLLHPTSATNAAILGDIIKELKAQGYRFGTLNELTAK